MSVLTRIKDFFVAPEPACVARQEASRLLGGVVRYHLHHDDGHGWDHGQKGPVSGYYLGSTTELNHARTLADYHTRMLREWGKRGEIFVFTIAPNGDCTLIDWRATAQPAVA